MPGDNEGRATAVERVFQRAMTDLLAGRLADALAGLAQCLTLDPDFAPAYSTRAGIHVREGSYEEARRDIEQALALRPDHITDLHNRAVVRTALDMYDGAIEDYETVLRREPASSGTLNNLAWVLATARDPRVRDGARAVVHAEQAVRLKRLPAWLDTLAAAHAECGDFAEAIALVEEAFLQSTPPNERFRRRLNLYRRGRTYAEWRAGDDEARE